MEDAAFADVRPGHKHRVRIDGGALAYADILAHIDAGEELGAASHFGMGPDVDEGINGHPFTKLGIGVDEGQGADSGKAALRRGKQLQNAAEILVGIFADQGASDIPGVFGTDDDGASPRFRELVSVFGICQKAHFIGPCPLQGVDADDFGIVSLQGQAKPGRDFGEFTGSHLLLTGLGFRELAAAGLPQTVDFSEDGLGDVKGGGGVHHAAGSGVEDEIELLLLGDRGGGVVDLLSHALTDLVFGVFHLTGEVAGLFLKSAAQAEEFHLLVFAFLGGHLGDLSLKGFTLGLQILRLLFKLRLFGAELRLQLLLGGLGSVAVHSNGLRVEHADFHIGESGTRHQHTSHKSEGQYSEHILLLECTDTSGNPARRSKMDSLQTRLEGSGSKRT